MQGTKRIRGSDLPVASFEFVPGGSQLARKRVGAITLAGEGPFVFRCIGVIGLRYLKRFSVRGSEKCGTRLGLLPCRGELTGERFGLRAFLPKCLLLLDLRRRSCLRGLQAHGSRRFEFGPEGDQFTREGVCPVPLLLSLLFQRLLLLDLCLGGLRDFPAFDPRGVEFGPE